MDSVEERVAFLEGKVEVQTDMINDIRETADRLERRFDQLELRMDNRFAAVDQRFAAIDLRFVGIEKRLDGLDYKLGWLIALWVTMVIGLFGQWFRH